MIMELNMISSRNMKCGVHIVDLADKYDRVTSTIYTILKHKPLQQQSHQKDNDHVEITIQHQ